MYSCHKLNCSRSVFSLVKQALTMWNSKTFNMRSIWHTALLSELCSLFLRKLLNACFYFVFSIFDELF